MRGEEFLQGLVTNSGLSALVLLALTFSIATASCNGSLAPQSGTKTIPTATPTPDLEWMLNWTKADLRRQVPDIEILCVTNEPQAACIGESSQHTLFLAIDAHTKISFTVGIDTLSATSVNLGICEGRISERGSHTCTNDLMHQRDAYAQLERLVELEWPRLLSAWDLIRIPR